MGKKQFIIGMVTGFLITAFLCGIGLSAKIIYDNQKMVIQDKQLLDARKEISNDVAKNAKSNSVLSDEDFIEKVMLIEDMVDLYYFNGVSDEDIKEGIIDGIMLSLDDPYACYYNEDELRELSQDTQGIYFGIGAVLQMDQSLNYPKITGIIDNSPASESELRVDDYIVEVDGTDIYDMELSEAVKLIKGPENTDVTLSIVRRATNEELDITLTRRKVESPTVKYEMLEDDIAYITITEFDKITVSQFKDALDKAYDEDMKALILDLRGNPGGSLDSVVQIADYMLPKGLIVYTEDKYGKREEYKSSGDHEIDVPMVVLINGGSASASEILSGAIKDYNKGVLMGTTTYGKGIVQRVMPLDKTTAIKFTVSHYYTPLGNDIHKVGIEPDIEVLFDVDAYLEDVKADNQKDEAVKYLKDHL